MTFASQLNGRIADRTVVAAPAGGDGSTLMGLSQTFPFESWMGFGPLPPSSLILGGGAALG